MRYCISSSQNPYSWYSHYSRPCSSDKSAALWVLTQKNNSFSFFCLLSDTGESLACLLWHLGLSHSFSWNYSPFTRQTRASTGLLAGLHCRTFWSASEGTTPPLVHLPPLGCWDLQFACSDVFLLDTNKYAIRFPSWTDVNFFYEGDQENKGGIPCSLMWGYPRFPSAQVNNSRRKRREEGFMWVPGFLVGEFILMNILGGLSHIHGDENMEQLSHSLDNEEAESSTRTHARL